MTADAVLQTLRRVWGALEPLNLPMAIMGGLALSRFKHFRATRDVNILIGIAHSDGKYVLDALAAVGIVPKRHPPVQSLADLQIAQLLYEPPDTFVEVQVDLLLADSAYHYEALGRRVPLLSDDMAPLYVLSCEDLILVKLMAGRMIDLADAVALVQLNATDLDQDYITHWADKLSLQSDWNRIRTEARDK